MRVAIVGAGISGLVVAHLLARDHEITVFEKGAYAGGHTNTIDVQDEAGPLSVDTGFIVFNDRNYPNFERLLERLGVASQRSDMSFGVSDEHGDFEYSSRSPSGLFAKRAHLVSPSFGRMVAELARFNRLAHRHLLDPPAGDDESLGQWLERHHFSGPFVDRLIVPQASAVWSADPAQMWSFPARFLFEFFANHGMLGFRNRPGWRTITGGSARYVEALTAPFKDRIRLCTPVESIARTEQTVTVRPRGGEPEQFDQVVIAAHSDQALAMLEDPDGREREILGAIPYQRNQAVLHTDRRLLPRRPAAWASWNFHLLDRPKPASTVTYHMNRLQSLRAREEYCVTLNLTEKIDPARVIRTIEYHHPVFTREGRAAQARVAEISGVRRTHYAGAYWRWGFHEDGVVSALRVAEMFGARL
jgi:predicted NAD/FAD-binding protein